MRWGVLLDEWGHSDKNTVTLLAVEIRCMKWCVCVCVCVCVCGEFCWTRERWMGHSGPAE